MKVNLIYTALIFTISVCIITISCTKKKLEPIVCFKEDVLPIFNSFCANTDCHNSFDRKEGIDLSNYEGIMNGIKKGKPRFSKYYTIIKEHEMPPEHYPQPTEQQIETIKQWINLGAMNSSCNNSCDTNAFNYSANVKPILDNYCNGCHNSSASGTIGNLTDFNTVQSFALNGSLMGSINHESSYSPMPKNQQKMDNCLIIIIQKWVLAGANNN